MGSPTQITVEFLGGPKDRWVVDVQEGLAEGFRAYGYKLADVLAEAASLIELKRMQHESPEDDDELAVPQVSEGHG